MNQSSVVGLQSSATPNTTPASVRSFLTTDDRRLLLRCFQLRCCLKHFVDRALHVEGLLRDVIVLAFVDLLETFYCVSDFNVAPRRTGELLRHVAGLRQEALDFSRPRHADLLVFA